jgi:hypothetical protein
VKKDKYWLILLKKWRENKRDGFSIPYILGSQNYLHNNSNYQNIEDLIIDISNGEDEIYITYCMDIDEIILGIRDKSKEKIAGNFMKIENQPSKLFKTKFVEDLGDDLETLIKTLNDKYLQDICDGKYSKNEGKLGGFYSNEIEFIKKCFVNL